MARTLLSLAAILAACTPSPEENAMDNSTPDPAAAAGRNASEAGAGGETEARAQHQAQASRTPDRAAGAAGTGAGARDGARAAQGPIPEPVSAADNPAPAPAPPADTPAEAQGRRTLSTAFVMVGPDGHLTVDLRGGRTLVLRDVAMRRNDYCGRQVHGGPAGKKFCGSYADVAGARPGGGPERGEPDLAGPSPVEGSRGAGEQN